MRYIFVLLLLILLSVPTYSLELTTKDQIITGCASGCDVGAATASYPSDPQYENNLIGQWDNTTIWVYNTGANALDFRIIAYPPGDTVGTFLECDTGLTECSVSASGSGISHQFDKMQKIHVEVKSASGTDFQVQVSGYSNN